MSLSFPRLLLAATLPAKPQPKGYKGGIFHLNVIDVFDQAIGKARVGSAYPRNIDLFNRYNKDSTPQGLFFAIGINSHFKLPCQESDQACYQAGPPLKTANGGCVRNLARKCLVSTVYSLYLCDLCGWFHCSLPISVAGPSFKKAFVSFADPISESALKNPTPICCSHFRMVVCLHIILGPQGSGRHRHRPTAEDPSTRRNSAGHPVPADQLGCWSLCHVTDLEWYDLLNCRFKLDIYIVWHS